MIRLTGADGEHAVLHDLGGSGPPLLLTHGNSLNTGMWATVVPHLQDGFHCWGLDFRGHGSARPQYDDMSVERSHFVDEAYERFVSKLPFSACEPAAVRAYVELGTYSLGDGAVRLSCSGDTEARIYVTGRPIEYTKLSTVRCPAVMARGGSLAAKRNDTPPKLAQPIAEALGNGRLKTFTELGHFGPMENSEEIAQDIRVHLEPLIAA